jgi:hypothetical protein
MSIHLAFRVDFVNPAQVLDPQALTPAAQCASGKGWIFRCGIGGKSGGIEGRKYGTEACPHAVTRGVEVDPNLISISDGGA